MTTGTLTKKYTIEEFLALPKDGNRYELVDGELIEMAGAREEHSRIGNLVGYHLTGFVLANQLGEVYNSEARYAVVPDSDTVRLPDVSFVSAARVTRGVRTMQFAPDLAVEVLSDSNTYQEIERKVKEYFGKGGQLVWVINLEDKEAYIYRSGSLSRQTLTETAELDGEQILPGFKLPLAELFK
jgi:Uma2 family endonuclease